VTDPLIVTVNVPAVVFEEVLMVSVTVTGSPEVGSTEFDGWKLQLAPEGKPVQARLTACANGPEAVT